MREAGVGIHRLGMEGGGGRIQDASMTHGSRALGSVFFRVMKALNQRPRNQTWTVVVSIVPQAGLMALSVPRS